MRRWIAALATVVALHSHVTVGLAQDQGFTAAVYTGNCDDIGNEVAQITPMFFGLGDWVGSGNAIPAAVSFSSIPASMDTLLSSDHVIVMPHPVVTTDLSCGEIGGPLTAEGSLILGLHSVEGSRVTGIAYLDPNDDPSMTDISLFAAGAMLQELSGIHAQRQAQIVESPEAPLNEPIVEVGFSAEERAYSDKVIEISSTMATSFDEFAILMEDPRLGDDTWALDVAAQLAIWKTSYVEAIGVDPPAVFEEPHSLFLESMRLYSEAADDAALGFDTFDIVLIEQATEKMTKANELLRRASELVNEIAADRSE